VKFEGTSDQITAPATWWPVASATTTGLPIEPGRHRVAGRKVWDRGSRSGLGATADEPEQDHDLGAEHATGEVALESGLSAVERGVPRAGQE
jgi:hypothetical protein